MTHRPAAVALTAVLGLIAACNSHDQTQPAAAALTLLQLQNADYPSSWAASGHARLVNGQYHESAAPGAATEIAVRATEFHAFGDLDGDGTADAVIVLESNPGGSGVFFDLAPVLNRGGVAQPQAITALGDRVEIDGLSLHDGRVAVQLVKHGPDDPQCCPSLKVTQRYRFDGRALALETQEPSLRSDSPETR